MTDKVLATGKHARLIHSNGFYFLSPVNNPLIGDTACVRFNTLKAAEETFEDIEAVKAGFSVGRNSEIGIGYFQ